MSKRVLATFALGLVFLVIACTNRPEVVTDPTAQPASAPDAGEDAGVVSFRHVDPADLKDWKEIDALVDEQKFAEALKHSENRLERAKETGDEEEWTRALIKVTQLRIGLHGYETQVRVLQDEPWPRAPLYRSIISLFYARTLSTYVSAYQWEIRQRERTEAKGKVDLKAWTIDQLYAEIQRAYEEVWSRRDALGERKVQALGEYVQPNNYPAGVRDTLRDAVSYLRVEHLADTTGWRPEHHNEIYRLNLDALIRADPAFVKQVNLTDPATHPLVKIAAVLGDLEGWHEGRGEKDAAQEARLERFRRLFAADSDEDRHATLRKALEASLKSSRSNLWWSMGMATLGEFQRQDGLLVLAHHTAREGASKHPQSTGAQACLHLQKSIEAPDYAVQSMAQDGPQQRSIEITHRNFGELHFRAYAVDLEDRIRKARDYNLLPAYDEMRALLPTKATATWSVKLPQTPDFTSHRTFSTPPLTAPGLYVVLASTRADFVDQQNRIMGLNLIVTQLAVLTRIDQAAGAVEATVTSAKSGDLIPGARVSLYQYDYRSGHREVEAKTTGADGTVKFVSSPARRHQSYFVVVKKGEDVTCDPQNVYLGEARADLREVRSLVYTDRSIYRPNQKLLFKVIAFAGHAAQARYNVLPQSTVTVRLMDANGQLVDTKTLRTNAYGSASGEFTLPSGRLLGQWRLQTDPEGGSEVRVEEYKRPTFTAQLKDAEGALRLNKPATFTGSVKYYFGLPVVNGTVRWRVSRAPIYPWWWGWWWSPPQTQPQMIANGTTSLDEEGTFKVTFTPEAEEPKRKEDKAISWAYSVSCDVTDEGGETRTAERTFRLGWISVEARIDQDDAFFSAGAAHDFTVRRTDLNGAPRAGKGAWRVLALEQPATPVMPVDLPAVEPGIELKEGQPEVRTAGDALRPRWDSQLDIARRLSSWKDGPQKAQGEVVHGEQGTAQLTVPPLAPGAYRLRYETKDDFGETFETFHSFIVANDQTRLSLPMFLRAQSSSTKVGGAAKVLVGSGFEGQLVVVDLYRGARRIWRRELRGGKDATVLTLPVTEADRGGFTVTATMVRDHQAIHHEENIHVPWDDRELAVEFATFRDKIRPGAKETWRVTVKGKSGADSAAAAAELLAYMYDEALDIFAPHNPPSPMSLWPGRTGSPWFRQRFGRASAQWLSRGDWYVLPPPPYLSGDHLRFFDGYGIGGPGGRHGGYRNKRAMLRKSGATFGAVEDKESRESSPAGRPAPAPSVAQTSPAAPPKEADSMDQAEPKSTPAAADPAEPIRTNFSETAFWSPHLLLGADGSAIIEFTVPDSVTGWNVWVHAVTKDLRAGSVQKKTRSVKELMVRPYVPRFLREGDKAELAVVVNNASDGPMKGTVSFDIIDVETQKSVLLEFGVDPSKADVAFQAAAGKGTHLSFPIVAPKRTGTVAFRVTAKSGTLSDGELRPLPLLPSRMHLVQSRFATLRDAEKKVLSFADMAKGDDPTLVHEQLVVSLDAQLFYQVLNALPYLVNYPYECTEQTLNRFVSTGILSSLYDDYPAVASMSKKLSARQVPLETWDAKDPNRKMTLEETPWVEVSQGSPTQDPAGNLVNVLDPKIATAEREASLAKLKKAQTSNGAFPWWPGGPPSPYMTLYMLHGFARAADHGVEVPKDVTQRAWGYVAQHYRSEYSQRLAQEGCCWEFLTFLNYVASSFPDTSYTGDALTLDERRQILDYSFKHWKQHSPYLKGYLALTLKRMGREKDAKLVWDSVMDSAKTTEDQGTFWAAEDRSWLWYNDTVETHAFALTTLMQLSPKDARRHGLVQWLLINKKLSHWKSTRATAEAIFALTKYLEAEGALGVKEDARVVVGAKSFKFEFKPDEFTGKNNRVVIPGDQVDGKTMSSVTVEKTTKGFMFASASWHFSTDKLPQEDRGDFFNVSRTYFLREKTGREVVLKPLAEGRVLKVGDEVEVQLSLRNKHAAEYVHLRDPRAAGLEPENPVSRYKWQTGLGYYEETKDSGANFFFDWLPVGEYTFKYRLRANMAGEFRVGSATVQSMYAPEFNAYSAGHVLKIAR